LPFELSDQYPILKAIKDQLNAAVTNPRFTEYTSEAYSAWTLFAQSATACGANLTSDCVLSKAGAHTDWTGGGLTPPFVHQPERRRGKQLLAGHQTHRFGVGL
jgi:hypothetical protein